MPKNNDIPAGKPRHFLPLALKVIGAHLALILIILVPLGIHENRQAERDWLAFKTHWKAKGEIFELEKLIPPEIPDAENFAKVPIIAELFDEKNPSQISSLDFYEFPAFKEVPLPKDHKISDSNSARGGHSLQLIEYFESEDKELIEKEAAKLVLQAYKPHF